MQVELIAEPTFTVKANGREIKGMRVVSEWKGFKELQDAQGLGMVVLDSDGPMSSALRGALSPLLGAEGRRCVVVLASPDLLVELTPAKPTEAGHVDT